ncbi:M16 family metallopeptidase [Boudabousia marimammalium]|uniref:Peptidase M16 n=1 Tax=Boudabousia marimammalium TaxID=156892 RepID=A0A1Q5PP36_9ACTO|nr:pitrilysin family protein [Boudabousia marimammalium]OKL49272.1 peptidase M16 [Boudabousia marimammalium]
MSKQNRIELPSLPASNPNAFVSFDEDGATVKRSVLPGGIRVITQRVPATRSVAVGAWLPVGSRDEHDGHYGSTHFLEHLLFKGTKTRTALQIASAFDEVGGQSNASTSKDYTNYHAQILAEDLPMAIEVLLDMVTSSLLDKAEMDMERGVILEELAAAADDPTDVLFDDYAALVYAGSALARPVGGTRETVSAVTREAIWEHYQRTYSSQNLVVAAAGNLNHEQVCEMVLTAVARGHWDTTSDSAPSPVRPADAIPDPRPGRHLSRKSVEQGHIAVGTRSLPMGDERRSHMMVLASVLGSGMSSRLFQEVRERRGLAYTTFAFNQTYTEAGSFGMYAGCKPSNLAEIERVMVGEWEKLAAHGPTAEELRRITGQTRGSVALGMESNYARMHRLGRSEVSMGHIELLSDQLNDIEAVTAADVATLATELLDGPRMVATVAPELL